ncbi:MAG: hypothetical protein M1550_07445 [Deltaproteobacteria bacterium]|nr:hypothetical protein [Deltaproteobacteria bacterium]
MRRSARVFLFAAALHLAAGSAVAGGDFSIRIDGKILRKASEKLVLSLSAFELSGRKEVVLTNRRTREARTVPLSAVYEDSCYTDELPADFLASLDEEDWSPSVTWVLPDTVPALNERLNAVHKSLNILRRELGNALLDESEPGSKVSSRLVLNKIEKYHRIGAVLARRIRELSRQREDHNPFNYPIVIQSGFNPFSKPSTASARSPVRQAREVMYWEVYRLLDQELGVDEELVDLVYDAPSTVRRIAPIGEPGGRELADFVPTVVLSAESIDAAVYLGRQGFGEYVKKLIRLRMYGDPFIKDRPVLDTFVNEGRVVAVTGRKAAVTFVPPFMKTGETLYVTVDEKTGEEIPVVPADPRPDEGFTLTADLPADQAARLRPGMVVRRH